MDEQKKISFEEIVKQNRRRTHYHLRQDNLHDPHQEYFQEGLLDKWNAKQNYFSDTGILATYFNYTIRKRLTTLVKEKVKV